MQLNCPCCSHLSYQNCCEPYHLGLTKPSNPTALMRSRYTAYTLHLVDYLIKTTHPSQVHLYQKAAIAKWAKSNRWLKLEICSAKDNVVEFKAHYQNGLKTYIHHEISTFKKEKHILYYLKGTYSMI